jgi:hypothetical protein
VSFQSLLVLRLLSASVVVNSLSCQTLAVSTPDVMSTTSVSRGLSKTSVLDWFRVSSVSFTVIGSSVSSRTFATGDSNWSPEVPVLASVVRCVASMCFDFSVQRTCYDFLFNTLTGAKKLALEIRTSFCAASLPFSKTVKVIAPMLSNVILTLNRTTL